MPDVMERDKERVRRVLRSAFANVERPKDFRTPSDTKALSHEECVEFRSHLSMLMPDDLKYFLPQILEDLLDTHTGDDVETEDAEFVLMSIGMEGEQMGFHWTFENYTREQAQAICEWLTLARPWQDFRLYADVIESAIEYWCMRASK